MPVKIFNLCLAIILIFANLFQLSSVSAQSTVSTASKSVQAASTDNLELAARLAAIEQAVEVKRQALGIPGLSLAIVKGDETLFIKGFGLRDLDKKLPVTPDTLFAIGSATKAFTAMMAVISADAGKLSLDDSPKKFLPYFKLADPEADAQITLRDLLSHRSGLNRTDLAMVTGKLSREELIQVAGMAKPAAKLREKFLYQNIMYTAAGEAVAKANGKSWETLIGEQLLKPLGMNATTLTVREMQQRDDFSDGYDLDFATKQTHKLKTLDLYQVAPCGAINSNARDMVKWLRLMLAGGVFEGKRLVSNQGFNELITKQIAVSPDLAYGLGWFIRDWQGHKVIEHGGNIDGFNAMVTMMPDEKLGVVLLTNVSISQIDQEIGNIVWSNLLNKLEPIGAVTTADANTSVDAKNEVGSYLLAAANLRFEVKFSDNRLTLIAPGQPEYKLENVGGRRYKFADHSGFFVTFRPAKDNDKETEMYLEQPQGNVVLARADSSKRAPLSPAEQRALKELVGSYENEQSGKPLDISERDNRIMLISTTQPPRALLIKDKDIFLVEGLPDTISISVKRDNNGKISGFFVKQPGGDVSFRRLADTEIALSVDELMAKIIEAEGGKANLRKHNSMVVLSKSDLVNQGITSENITYSKAPNLQSSDTTLIALGKKIGSIHEYFDGNKGGVESSFGTPSEKTGNQLDEIRLSADFYQQLNWKQLFKNVQIKRLSKIGDEDVYVVVKTPEKGNPITEYISTRSFLLLRRDTLLSYGDSGLTVPVTEIFSDYKLVDGVKVPFKISSTNPDEGETITQVQEVKFNIALSESAFQPLQTSEATASGQR